MTVFYKRVLLRMLRIDLSRLIRVRVHRASMAFARVLLVSAVPARFLTARCHRSPFRSLELGNILAEHVASSESGYQIVELALVIALPVAVRFVLLAQ